MREAHFSLQRKKMRAQRVRVGHTSKDKDDHHMAEVHLRETQIQGYHALILSNQFMSMTLIPELGGKISSICDLRSRREWLWTNSLLPYRQQVYGTSYVQEADTGGWDECFPTVAASLYPPKPGLHIPDHGEIWSQEWPLTLAGDAATARTLHTQACGVALPYEFHRTISFPADAATLRFDYRVKNLADKPLSFIWSCHPIFAIEQGMRLLLPEDASMRVFTSEPSILLSREQEYTWPLQVAKDEKTWDLSSIPEPGVGIACKLWSQPLSQGYAALVASDGEFRFTFDPSLLPQIGLWINASAWSGIGAEPYYNLALEPCIGAQDSLAEAIECYKQYKELPAHDEYTWWLEVHLSVL